MESPFINDMFAMVYKAFKNLYPDKEAECQWQPIIPKNEHADDGSIYVDISANLRVVDAVETLAHELAHVAVGAREAHGEAWEKAFDAIHNEFDRIGNEMFGDEGTAVDVVSGKAHVKGKSAQ